MNPRIRGPSVYFYMCVYVYVYIFMCVCIYVFISICVCIRIFLCIFACMYVCMYVCLCMYICMYLCKLYISFMYVRITSCVSKPMSQTFPVYSPPQLSKNVPINMGLKLNRFRDIHCCVEIREML
jgi:nuclear pore complex protein Nup62